MGPLQSAVGQMRMRTAQCSAGETVAAGRQDLGARSACSLLLFHSMLSLF